MTKNCIVKGCTNTSKQGEFVGDICKPCYEIITTGRNTPTTSILNNIFKYERLVGHMVYFTTIWHKRLIDKLD